MNRILLITLFSFVTLIVSGQGRVGINTPAPFAMLHVKDSNVVFTGNYNQFIPGAVPVSGPGSRMMWYVDKAAFRAGHVTSDTWNKNNIGLFSAAVGFNPFAKGDYSFAQGYSCLATGEASVAMGNTNTASGFSSFAIGSLTKASGDNAFSTGERTTAKSFASVAFGRYNDTTSISSTSWNWADPLFIVGNGASHNSRNNALTILKNGNIGIGMINPSYLLNFPAATGDKISLYGTTINHYGLGIQSNQLQIHTADVNGAIVFGYGNSDQMTETVVITGSGNLGIGHTAPLYPLSFNSLSGNKISLNGSGGGHYGFGIQPGVFQVYSSGATTDIAFGYGHSWSFTEIMRIKGNGKIGIGTNAPAFKLDVADRMRLRTGPGGESAGIWFNKIDNSSAVAFVGMLNDEYIGIYGEQGASWNLMMSTVNGYVGIGTQSPTEKLHVTGNGKFTGAVFASCGTLSCSDIRYKNRISPLSSSLENILLLQGIYYYWDKEKFPEQQFNDARQIGFIAQEVEKFYPEMVHTDADGYKSVDYSRMTPVLLEAIKEQQKEIEELKEKVERLMTLMGGQ